MFRLALALGRTVEELLESISYEELTEWGHFYNTDPFGEWRADARSAQIVAMLANINRDPNKHPDAYKLSEFMLFDRLMPEVKRDQNEGARIAPETLTWFFANAKRVDTNVD